MTCCLLKELLSSLRDYISTCWRAAPSGVLFCFHKSHGNTNGAGCETQWEQRSAVQARTQGLPGSAHCLQHQQTWTRREKKMNKANICLETIIIIILKVLVAFSAFKYFQFRAFPGSIWQTFTSTAFSGKQLPICCLLCENPLPFPCFDHVSH